MISYNLRDWFTFLFRLHKVDTFRQLLPLIIGISLYAAALSYAEIEWFKLEDNKKWGSISVMYSLLGFVISLLLVFRTNTAYERWWEGRRLWGSLVNSSRNFALKLNTVLHHPKDRMFFRIMTSYYPLALKAHLRSETSVPDFDEDFEYSAQSFSNGRHLPNQVAARMYQRLVKLRDEKAITENDLWLADQELRQFTDICGACERIKNTPIPFIYSIFLKKFIFFYVMLLPVAYVSNLGYLVVPFTAFIFYVLASIEVIAEEIENPFGTDGNDLPLEALCGIIKKTVGEVFENN